MQWLQVVGHPLNCVYNIGSAAWVNDRGFVALPITVQVLGHSINWVPCDMP